MIVIENSYVPVDPRAWNEAVTLRDAGWRVTVICPAVSGVFREDATQAVIGGVYDLEGVTVYRFALYWAEKGIKSGDKVIVKSGRGELWAIAIVTSRFKPFKVAGSTVHQVGLPWHFGWQYPEDGSGGDSANLLTPTIGDANTMIPESKAFMVNVVKA